MSDAARVLDVTHTELEEVRVFRMIEDLGDRVLAGLVPRLTASAAACRRRPAGCSASRCSGSCRYRCCFSSPPPVTCTGCVYR
jgi:hypothetical protein